MINFGSVIMCDPEPDIVRFEEQFMSSRGIRGVATSSCSEVLELVERARAGGRPIRAAVVDLDAVDGDRPLACSLLEVAPQVALVVTGAWFRGLDEVIRASAKRIVFLQKPFSGSELAAALLEAS